MNKIEEIEEYWNHQPCGIKHGSAGVGSSLWSHQVTARRYFVEFHILPFAEFDVWKGKRVLELGCGIGTDTLQFAKAGASQIDAVDISKASLDLAIQRAQLNNLKNISFYEGNIEEPLPFSANKWNTYDLVYSWGVLHHTPYPESVIRNAHNFVKPQGELRVMLYAKWSYKCLMGQQPEAQAGCPLVRWYSIQEAKRLIEANGFLVTSIRKTHIFPWRVKDYIEHRYVREFPWSVVPERWVEPYVGQHLLIKAVRA